MADRIAGAPTGATGVSEAYTAARDLLRQAEEDAAGIRADADRYRRQREQEAELLVAKARRVLAMAEQRATELRPEVVDLDSSAPEAVPGRPPIAPRSRPAASGLDSILATAVSNAIHRALPADR